MTSTKTVAAAITVKGKITLFLAFSYITAIFKAFLAVGLTTAFILATATC